MHRRARVCVFAATCFALALSATGAAHAAPTRWQSVTVVVHGLGSGTPPTLIVRGTLPDDTPLPATVALPVPGGCDALWVWQVSGSDPMTDRMLPFTRRGLGECDVIDLTLEEGRTVQAEMEPPLGWISTTPAGTKVALRWEAVDAVERVSLSFEVAHKLHAEQLRPSRVDVRSTDEATVYTLTTEGVEAGDVLTLSATIVPGSDRTADVLETAEIVPHTAQVHEPHSTTPVVLSVLAVGLAALLVTGIFAVRAREVRED